MLFERKPNQTAVEKNATARSQQASARSYAEQTVNPETALTVSAVLGAFTILAEDVSTLPLILYERKGNNQNRAYKNPYYELMHDQPNPEHSSMIFRELMVAHMLAWGNFFGQFVTDGAGTVQEIWPLRPDRMTVRRINGQRVYVYQTTGGDPRVFFQDEILHIPAFGFDGLIGYSRIALARNAIGLSIAAEKFGSKFFSNDARPGIALKHPGSLSDTAYDRLVESWDEKHKGVEKSHGVAILEEGMDIATLGIPPEDAQFLETRKFQVSEIARIFRVPPHMIGDVSGSTSWGSGIDSQEQGYVNHTLRPWTVRVEQNLNTQLLLADERKNLYFEHLLDGLLRGDLAARYTAYVQAVTNGLMSPNEVRSRENLNPYQGGDSYYHPLNLQRGNEPSNPPAKQSATALEPLFLDAARRVIKREANDLRGAARRFLAKGQVDEFQLWAAQFYKWDHPEFIKRQFEAVLDAQNRLFDRDERAGVDSYFEFYLNDRIEWLADASLERIEAEIEMWNDQSYPLQVVRAMHVMEPL
jgi:HK97 family phage portal protein